MKIAKGQIARNVKDYHVFTIVLILVPIVCYCFLVAHFSINIPMWDDYDTILTSVTTTPFSFTQLLAQHNEHRIGWTRLIAKGYYYIVGEINFKYLAYIGNLALLILFILLLKIFTENKLPIILFIPISYMLFNSQSWENMTWSTGALQNYYILLFILLTLYFWNKKTALGYVVSFVFGITATYTSGNGILIFFLLLAWETKNVYTALNSRPLRHIKHIAKSQLQFLFLIAITACLCYLYFNGYRKPPHHPSMIDALFHPVLLIQYIGILLGSYVGFIGKALAFWIGVFEIIIFLFFTYTKYYKKNSIIYYFLLFIFFSIFIAALGRAGFGLDQALSPRYRILAIMALIFLYWAFIECYPKFFLSKKIVVYCITTFAIGFNMALLPIETRSLSLRKDFLIEGITKWKHTGEGLNYPDPERASLLLKQSLEKGIYRLPDL
jgi:hypothetical protein